MTTSLGWTSTPITAELLRGALELEPTEHGVLPHRLPAWARAQCPDPQLLLAESQPAGVRVAVRTRATAIELDTLATRRSFAGAPPRPDGVYDLLVDGELVAQAVADGATTIAIDMTTGAVDHRPGALGTLRFEGLPDREKDIEIWLPHNETTELGMLRADAAVGPVPDSGRPVWLHHGSSISAGSNATSSTATWTALAAAQGGVELVNLGLSGSALLDPFTARTMREVPADLLSVEIGINLVTADVMRLRAFGPAVHGFLDTLREGHPDAPLLVLAPLYCRIFEDTPGPGGFDVEALGAGRLAFRATGDPAEVSGGKLTLAVVRDELARIVTERADPNLAYLDGRDLYGAEDYAELPLPDELHPDSAAHARIGERFAERAFGPGGALVGGTPR
ncbi:GDSL-type esterase/lipase family protein [Georgenia sp. MJ206]|uniref:GDSL-type esterase/lipase family protein n=1 Tax=Georgenia wangjunii TaxID=3117730 RepID=UPI002F26874B